jgi:hypothetical protein
VVPEECADMPTDDDRPPILPSPVDPDVECVRIDTLVPSGELAQPPGPPPTGGDDSSSLCPDGYVPRRRRRRDYTLEGKEIVTSAPPKRNPDDPTGA